VVENLPSKCEALNSKTITAKNKNSMSKLKMTSDSPLFSKILPRSVSLLHLDAYRDKFEKLLSD
jgi:hypothetical protein